MRGIWTVSGDSYPETRGRNSTRVGFRAQIFSEAFFAVQAKFFYFGTIIFPMLAIVETYKADNVFVSLE